MGKLFGGGSSTPSDNASKRPSSSSSAGRGAARKSHHQNKSRKVTKQETSLLGDLMLPSDLLGESSIHLSGDNTITDLLDGLDLTGNQDQQQGQINDGGLVSSPQASMDLLHQDLPSATASTSLVVDLLSPQPLSPNSSSNGTVNLLDDEINVPLISTEVHGYFTRTFLVCT